MAKRQELSGPWCLVSTSGVLVVEQVRGAHLLQRTAERVYLCALSMYFYILTLVPDHVQCGFTEICVWLVGVTGL